MTWLLYNLTIIIRFIFNICFLQPAWDEQITIIGKHKQHKNNNNQNHLLHTADRRS
jgi:hypothetical protein